MYKYPHSIGFQWLFDKFTTLCGHAFVSIFPFFFQFYLFNEITISIDCRIVCIVNKFLQLKLTFSNRKTFPLKFKYIHSNVRHLGRLLRIQTDWYSAYILWTLSVCVIFHKLYFSHSRSFCCYKINPMKNTNARAYLIP